MQHSIYISGSDKTLYAEDGENLLALLRRYALAPYAPCGGTGLCGKCTVEVNGESISACRTEIREDMLVRLPDENDLAILSEAAPEPVIAPGRDGFLAAFDIGTTTLVGYLLSGKTGEIIASKGMRNPQVSYGSDVLSRVRAASEGKREELTGLIRAGANTLLASLCERAGIAAERIEIISVVGNPCMQQLFLGMAVDNLAAAPFVPVLRKSAVTDASEIFPAASRASLLTVPDIGGFLGADTLGCVLASGMDKKKSITLLADIGTNGELVLGNRDKMLACSAAGGPALEGAGIRFGMRAETGAIDRVWLEGGEICCRVIGGGEAKGICGSGLIDAAAVFLSAGIMDRHGRLKSASALPAFASQLMELDSERVCRLTRDIYITQSDIRALQLAKGAICAGAELLISALGITADEIGSVELAGAFGSCLDGENACRIGLLPPALSGKLCPIGNAAGAGARMLARDPSLLRRAEALAESIEVSELAAMEDFPRCFAENMEF